MAEKPTYEELEQRIKELGKRVLERKPAEEALIKSEKLYRLIVENVTDIIWIVDMEMKFTYFSPSVIQMRGYSVEEAMAQSVEESMTPASFESAMKIIAEELELHYKGERDPAKSRKMEAELTCKDGSTVWTEIEANFIYNSEGQPTGILGITRNITERKESEKERKRAAEALRESEERYRSLFENMMEGFAYCRMIFAEGRPQDLLYLDVNNAFEKLTGLKDVVGRKITEVIPGIRDANPELLEIYGRVALTGKPERFENYFEPLKAWLSISVYSPAQGYFVAVFDNITERKRAEESMRESEDKFKHVFDHSIIGKSITFPSGEMQTNKAFYEMLGYSKEEFLDFKWQQITHPDDVELSQRVVDSLLSGEKDSDRFIKRYIHKDGSVVWADVGTVLRRDKKGHPLYLMATISDITEQKKAEEALKESETKFRAIFEHMEAASCLDEIVYDGGKAVDYRILNVNPSYEKILGVKKEKVIGSLASQVYGTGEAPFLDIFSKVAETGQPASFEAYYAPIDKYLQVTSSCPEKGKFSNTFSDITERKRTEEERNKLQAQLSNAMEMAHLGHWEYDVANDLFTFNDHFYKIFRTTAKQIGGYTMSSAEYARRFLHPDDMHLVVEETRKAVEATDPHFSRQLEHRMLYADGTVGHITVRFFIVKDAHGRTVKAYGVNQDITERKQAEEALKISRENLLEEYNQRKILSKKLIDLLEKDRHYIAMELHDNIGQILTSLKINLEIINDKLKPNDTELGSLIKAAGRRAKQAIVDLNNIAHGLMPGILDVLGLVSSLRTLLDEVKEHTDIKIDFFNRNVPKRFDQKKELAIYRIVQEALNNIIKHAKAKNVYVSLLKKGNVLFLSVEDDGVGFDQDKEMKISNGKGPLGLIIMQERAMQLDGELTIESEMGKGTHLLVEIPI